MKKRELGQSGLFASEIGLGCMSLPTNNGEAQKIVDAAIDHGITYFDTADLYDKGENEVVVGHALKGKRHNILLATKVGNKWREDEAGWTWDSSSSYITKQVKESLTRLQTDYIDLYQLHGGTMEDNLEEAVDAFESLKKEGLIRAYGISSIRPNVVNRFLEKDQASSVMMQYSMLDRRPEEWFELIASHGASVVTRGSLAKGLLTAEAMKRVGDSKDYGEYSKELLLETLSKIGKHTEDLTGLALAFVLQHKQVAAIVAGASSEKQITSTIDAYHRSISTNDLEQVTNILRDDRYKEHRIKLG
ncbi:aldo/keto reductase [Paenisporosarcina antarctica]|uniref:Aldo/keto reductase n=1 Tax=Paenisporosarcina antarctica TaxID=417367 RepID=A0A4P6ZZ51_9BACL|nr:aldo/keto reductase [Paenisporosarcina antarctica]QBP41389.1 aldo/keto reductase [Paenisporosarcina antarctica]